MSEAEAKGAAVERVARAIARVIAIRELEGDPGTRRLGGLEMASARTTMVDKMWPHLLEEAEAAIAAMPEPVS